MANDISVSFSATETISASFAGAAGIPASTASNDFLVGNATAFVKKTLAETKTILGVGGGGTWGSITGTLSAQTDLYTKLFIDAGISYSAAITCGNKGGDYMTAPAGNLSFTNSGLGHVDWGFVSCYVAAETGRLLSFPTAYFYQINSADNNYSAAHDCIITFEKHPLLTKLFYYIQDLGTDLTTSIIAAYKLDEASGNAIDSVSAVNGTVTNATYNQIGKLNKAYSFSGNGYVNLNSLLNSVQTFAGTISAWINMPDSTPAANMEIVSAGYTTAAHFFQFAIDTNGKLFATCMISAATKWTLQTDAAITTDNTWVHVLITHNGTTPELSVNGVQVAQTFTASADKTIWLNDMTLNNVRIADGNRNSLGEGLYFTGLIDDVNFWSRAINDTEITDLYNVGNGLSYPFY